MTSIFWSIDFPALIIAALAGLGCGLCGALLFLKKQTMIADTLSHSLLPGLALAYIITGGMSFIAMLCGALGACIFAAILIFFIKQTSIIDEGSALGVTLTGFLALGVIMLETLVGSDVHLDTEHALYGALELIYWPDTLDMQSIPRQIPILLLICAGLSLFIVLFHSRLKLYLLDYEWAKSSGQPVRWLDAVILMFTALIAVASFEAVGVILVLALIVCPPAIARFMTDKFSLYIIASAAAGCLSALAGYYLGAVLPLQMGMDFSLNAAGSIAFCACILVFASYQNSRARIKA